MIRQPAVAGTFYPAQADELREAIRSCLQPTAVPKPCIGAMAPHAGYVFSGPAAGELYSQIEIPHTVIILAPNHRGPLKPFALSHAETWRTPLGDVPIDADLAARILEASPLIEEDDAPHRFEHSAEVQVPFLQYLRSDVKIVPIVIAEHKLKTLLEVGQAIASCIEGNEALILASSDMTHFEPSDVAKRLDSLALDRVLALDPEGLHRTVLDNRISMCGFAPTVIMLGAARELGATSAELIRYSTSGDVTGDDRSVVGYASVRIF